MSEKVKSIKKRQLLDYVVAAIGLAGLIVSALFWQNNLEIVGTILVFLAGVALTILLINQNKKLQKRYESSEN